MTTTISTGFRYITLQVSRTLGRIYYWLRHEWRPPVFWLIVTTLIVCLPYFINDVHKANPETWDQWLYVLAQEWWNVLSAQWWHVLAVYTILLLLWWTWKAKKRVVIEDFMDYTMNPPKSDSRGLATLLVVNLAQLQELYRVVDEQRALSTEAKSNQPIDATIKVEDVSEFLSNAISAQAKFSLGPLEIPVGTLLSLIGRLVQGPRILGSLHKDKDVLILTAQRVGSQTAYNWRVDRKFLSSTVDQDSYNLDDMVEELACRMFTDLALSGSVRWRATSTFCEGLRFYRDCLRTPRDNKLKLKQAEKKFIETLAEDREYASANYNLGVLYMELNHVLAAEEAFLRAIGQNPGSWRGHYALAACRSKLGQYESVIELCDQVSEGIITRKPGIANIAMVYHSKGIAQSCLVAQNREIQNAIQKQRQDQQDEFDTLQSQIDFFQMQTTNISNLERAIQSYKKAVTFSWRALCRAERLKKGVTETENRVIPQRETVASACLIDLAIAYSEQAQEWSEIAKYYDQQIKNDEELIKSDKNHARLYRASNRNALKHKSFAFGRAKALFKQANTLFRFATSLTSINTNTYQALINKYADNHFHLARTYYDWGKYDEAIEEYTTALQYHPEEAKYWAYKAVAFAEVSHTQLITLPSTAGLNIADAKRACEKALSCLSSASPDTLEDSLEKIVETYDKLGEEGNRDLVRDMKVLLKEYDKLVRVADSDSAQVGQESGLSVVNLEEQLSRYTKEEQAWKRAQAWICAQASLVLGRLSLASSRPQEAERHFKKAIEWLNNSFQQEIKTQELRVLLVYALLNQKKHDEALEVAEQALVFVPYSYFEREALGDAYFTLNQFEDAIAAWQDALLRRDAFMRKSPDLPKLDTSAMRFKIGDSYLPKSDALDIHYKIGISYVELAEYYRDLTKRSDALKQAIMYLEQAQSFSDGDQQHEIRAIHYFLGFLHLELGEYEQAISYLQVAKTSHFMRPTSLFYLGCAYLKNKDYDAALKQFNLLLEEASKLERQGTPLSDLVEAEYVGFMSLGEILAMAQWGIAFTNTERNSNLQQALNQVEIAQNYIDDILKLKCPVHFPAYCKDCKGWILLKMGRIEDAISFLQQAVSLSSNPQGYLHLALAYERKRQVSGDDTDLLHEMQVSCQHVQELDIRKEYEQQVSDILRRNQETSKKPRFAASIFRNLIAGKSMNNK
jgi:tetratricopeptide (TPR) repeat protein